MAYKRKLHADATAGGGWFWGRQRAVCFECLVIQVEQYFMNAHNTHLNGKTLELNKNKLEPPDAAYPCVYLLIVLNTLPAGDSIPYVVLK